MGKGFSVVGIGDLKNYEPEEATSDSMTALLPSHPSFGVLESLWTLAVEFVLTRLVPNVPRRRPRDYPR